MQVRGVLLDPSCSGSGTAASRLDALLPSRRSRSDAEELDEVWLLSRSSLPAARPANPDVMSGTHPTSVEEVVSEPGHRPASAAQLRLSQQHDDCSMRLLQQYDDCS